MNLLVIGVGYVGLVTATCLAETGHNVICLDIDKNKIDMLNNGISPIYEPGLEELVKSNIASGHIQFTTNYVEAVPASSACFICVDTPVGEDGKANLTAVKNAVTSIAMNMDKYLIIINKSTAPVGTAHNIEKWVLEILEKKGADFEFDVVSNPEFLQEGDALINFMKPERIVIGVDNQRAIKPMKKIYSPFILRKNILIIMDVLSAEMTKYAANAMLATRISFINEIAGFCSLTGVNINEVRKGMGADKRIGYSYLNPGLGYGGSCLPKDTMALRNHAKSLGYDMKLISAVIDVNQSQKLLLPTMVDAYYKEIGGVAGKTFAILGLAFKPGTCDMREASSLVIIKELLKKGAKLRLYDPVAMENAKKLIPKDPNVTWCENEYDAASDSDAIVLATEWKQFQFLDFSTLLEKMKGNAFFDGRNQYNPYEMSESGFDYMSIGVKMHYAKDDD